MHELDPDLRALQEVRDLVARAKRACESIHRYTQAQADALCAAMAKAAANAAYDLAKLAVDETGIGRVHYKVLKNLFGAEGTWASIKDEKTVGVVSRDEKRGVIEVATAAGVIAGIIPTTNPTSTAINKALISVKGKNAIVISPHPRARRSIGETVEVLRRAIERAGGSPDLVLCLSNPTIESTGALMKHKDVALILATGGTGLVRAAYSSGKPAYGVGPGNVPAYVDRSADIAWAAQAITSSQSFDNATLCCSEQGLVLDRPIAGALIAELVRRGAHVCDEYQTELLARLCNQRGHMNPDVVGLDPARIAAMAGFKVPDHTTILLAYQGGVGKDWPLSIEILAPVLSLHVVDGWQEGCKVCIEMLEHEGLGHTLGIHAKDPAVLDAFFLEKPANRILVNGPCSQGAVGYSTQLVPSMSLGCGPQAGNITSDNITARHLVNIKRVAYLRRDWADIERRDHQRAAALGGAAAPRANGGAAAPRATGGETAPRGSGLPGDPALAGGNSRARTSAFTPDAQSNWRGNPPVRASAPSSGSPSRGESPAHAGGAAPRANVPLESPAGRDKTPAKAESVLPSQRARQAAAPQSFLRPDTRGESKGSAASAVLARPAIVQQAVVPGASVEAASVPPWMSALTSSSRAPAGALRVHDVGAALSPSEIQALMAHAGNGCPLGPCKGCAHHEVTTGACLA